MNSSVVRLLYAVLILLGAFLSFAIQPLVGKIVTAAFGGSAAIWGVCLLFFQSVLLFGYLLTYFLSSRSPRQQSIVYALIVVASAICLNLPPPAGWSATMQGDVPLTLLCVLATHLAFPCLILTSISGMIQTWFNLSRLGNPYPLYSLSNIGSLGALLAYPILIEPSLSLTNSIADWKIAYYLLVGLVCLAAFSMFKYKHMSPSLDFEGAGELARESVPPTADIESGDGTGQAVSLSDISVESANKPGLRDFCWWTGLSAMGTLALVSYTAYLTQDIAPVPLIYVIPLCLYLLSFIIIFANDRNYKRGLLLYLTPVLWIAEAAVSSLWVDQTHATNAMLWSLLAVLTFMFCFFLTCQGELYRSKPAAKHLASFYLAIAFGGTLGGAFVNFGAPALFNSYVERYIVGLFIAFLWGFVVIGFKHQRLAKIADCAYGVITGGAIIYLLSAMNSEPVKIIFQKRNFFGCMMVTSKEDFRTIRNGRIMHGKQFVESADDRRIPTLYYRHGTGLDLMDNYLRSVHKDEPLKYGLVGLGAGTIAAYGREGDTIQYYEIDPKVISCAKTYFSFLSDSKAKVDVIAGDAREQLKNEPPQKFNLMVIDAFNGDAIPVHLLTREALKIYFSHLVPDGILLVHITNRFIDLQPVLGNLAASLNLSAYTMESDDGDYVVLSRDQNFKPTIPDDSDLKKRFSGLTIHPATKAPSIGTWTDDYSNLFATMLAKWEKLQHHK